MNTFLQVHLIQNFGPACLNRDENGIPKSTQFGNYSRARISSQCQKRATRLYYGHNYDDNKHRALRSRNWLPQLTEKLIQGGISESASESIAKIILTILGGSLGADNKLKTSLFLAIEEVNQIVDYCIKNYNAIEKEILKDKPSTKLEKDISEIVPKGTIPGDVAGFGRFSASNPVMSVDAAFQVAHAIGVNKLKQEFDFFTLADDLNNGNEQGADHLGDIGYNSSVYYRYFNIDINQLSENFKLDKIDKRDVPNFVESYLNSFIYSLPTGMQNSFAAHSLPDAILIVVDTKAVSLVNAFENPAQTTESAITALDTYWGDITRMHSNSSVLYKGIVTLRNLENRLNALDDCKVDSVDELIKQAVKITFTTGD